MRWLQGFFTQRARAYRDFQLAFSLLSLNFALPALGYLFAPQAAMRSFQSLNHLLGGQAESIPLTHATFFWVLGCANVAALAFMCLFLQWNLRLGYPVLWPLCFLKGVAASLWLASFLGAGGQPAYLAAALLDYLSCAAFIFFARRAYRAILPLPDDQLLPKPRAVAWAPGKGSGGLSESNSSKDLG